MDTATKAELEGLRENSPALFPGGGKPVSNFRFRASFGFRGFGLRISGSCPIFDDFGRLLLVKPVRNMSGFEPPTMGLVNLPNSLKCKMTRSPTPVIMGCVLMQFRSRFNFSQCPVIIVVGFTMIRNQPQISDQISQPFQLPR